MARLGVPSSDALLFSCHYEQPSRCVADVRRVALRCTLSGTKNLPAINTPTDEPCFLGGNGVEFPVCGLLDRQVDGSRGEAEQDAEIPDKAVRPRRVVDIAAQPDADERADLVAEEGNAIE